MPDAPATVVVYREPTASGRTTRRINLSDYDPAIHRLVSTEVYTTQPWPPEKPDDKPVPVLDDPPPKEERGDTPVPEPQVTVVAKRPAGWYELSDGRRVRGKKALRKLGLEV